MRTIRIAEGIEFAAIAMGESRRGQAAHEEEAFRVMDRFFELGGNTFDSARMYDDGGSDRALGKWLKSRGMRNRVNVVTKGNHPALGSMFVSRLSKAEIERDIEESLSYMGIDCSDLHLLHRDDVKKPVEEIVPVLSGLVKAGKTRAVGVSNWSVGRIIQANKFAEANGYEPLRCCQLHYSLAQTTAPITGDITHCPMNEIEFGWYNESQFPVMCFGAQARGWFAVRARGGEPTESPKRFYDILPENYRRLERLRKLSAETGRSMGAILAAYVRDSGLRAVTLCSFSSIAQAEEVMEADAFTLQQNERCYLETGAGL
ncbi:MAG: aldo/keto reductase [Clostridia bacterium]|nr:aldo/keto reductase [Clostridia bacterium]